MSTDYYKILNVDKGASAEEIKKSFRKQAVKLHPDKNPGDKTAEEGFKKLTEAYETLSDPEKRSFYDVHGAAPSPGQRQHRPQPEDFMSSFFGGNPFFRDMFNQGNASSVNADIEVTLSLTLEEVFKGCNKDITYEQLQPCGICRQTGSSRGEMPVTCKQCNGSGRVIHTVKSFMNQVSISTCNACRGTGRFVEYACRNCSGAGVKSVKNTLKVSVPAGINAGMRMQLSARGNHGLQGTAPGNLHILINTVPHDIFTYSNGVLYMKLNITYPVAVFGGLRHIDVFGDVFTYQLPRGTDHEFKIQINGRGMPNPQNGQRGLLVLKTNITIEKPQDLSSEQQELIEKLQQLFEQKR